MRCAKMKYIILGLVMSCDDFAFIDLPENEFSFRQFYDWELACQNRNL